MLTDKYLFDQSIISTLQQFCVLYFLSHFVLPYRNPSWELNEMKIHKNHCTVCNQELTKLHLSESQRDALCTSLDLMASMIDCWKGGFVQTFNSLFLLVISHIGTSFKRAQHFHEFKQDLSRFSSCDVIIDGANVGFTNANFRMKSGNGMALNTHNIECLVKSLVERDYHPLVVLHRYHLRHLRKDGSNSLNVLEVMLSSSFLSFFSLFSLCSSFYQSTVNRSPPFSFSRNFRRITSFTL